MTTETLSLDDKEFLAKCEAEFKDRYTDKDEEFMKVHTAPPPTPPIIESWWSSHSGQRNDRRFNRRNHAYQRPNKYNDRRYGNDDEYDNDRGQGHRSYNQSRYNY